MAKRLYEVKVVRAYGSSPMARDFYEFNVVSDSPVKAMDIALKRAVKQSGYSRIWRVTKLIESETRVIS